jgi:benzoyl-CoA reductase/2-hydroxyglutaryl-CoA dehydratase subunit BcrC/BadD/HgdB
MSNSSCRYFSLEQLELASHLREHLGLPVLSFEGDHMDPNRYNRERIEDQIRTFLDLLSRRA